MARVELSRLTRRFGDVAAVDGLNLEVGDGELFCLVGPSGCGKTTTLRLLAGLERADEGEIVIDGESVTALPPQARNVGVVFQSYALFPTMSVWKNVAYGLEVRKLPRGEIARRVAELLQLVGLIGFEARRPVQLSGGEQQRVALARALVIQPKLLLLDEPLSSLDAKLRIGLRREIKRIQRELGITTLVVTHDQEEAMAFADRIGVMRAGRLEQVGTPMDIYSRPLTAFVADFIGHSNLIHGRIEAVLGDTATVVVGENLRLALPMTSDVREGDHVWCSIRPQALSLNDWPRAEGGMTPFVGTVAALEFLGNLVRIEVVVAGLDRPLLLEMSPQHSPPSPGSQLHVLVDSLAVRYGVLTERQRTTTIRRV